jgi:polyisoprenoid-binding protein YceI
MKIITRQELEKLIEAGVRLSLIDVTPAEYFHAGHLPGAANASVYEVTFLDNAAKVAPDKAWPVVLYGSSTCSLASTTAAEKLERTGYTDVHDYRGDLDDWEAAGLPIEKEAPAPPPLQPRLGRHQINLEKSTLFWTGRNISGTHTGSIRLKEGWLDAADHTAKGEVTLDMNSIANSDIADGALNRILIAHLKSDDFFDTARFPTATFHLRHVTLNPHARPGSINADIGGALTLKGVIEDIGFHAIIEVLPGGALSAEAHFDIDRTRWNVLYGSGKFYERLGQNLVHDNISISLHIVTL